MDSSHSNNTGSTVLEIKLISCKGLNTFNFFQKLHVYAVASIGTDATNIRLNQHQLQEHRTKPDSVNDHDPVWNHSVSFDLSRLLDSALYLSDLFLNFQLFHHGNIFGDKLIGSVRVHLKDLATADHGTVRFVDYEICGPDGKPNGLIHFSYKPITGTDHQPLSITGYPVIDHSPDEKLYKQTRDVPVEEVDGSRVYYPAIDDQREISTAANEAEGNYYSDDYRPQMWHHPPPMWGPPPPPGPPPRPFLPAHMSAYPPPPFHHRPPPPPPWY